MNEFKEYLETGKLGTYHPEKATIKKSENGTAIAVYQDSDYSKDKRSSTRERSMIIKGKRFIISSVFPLESTATATDKILELIDADMRKK